ncbi:MAG: ribosome assembly RNA-binding protein YhbY [Dokdonella sp.]|nr:MAG: ribosome assembly RNA-binding protein YhbY [Dokdonella sp.]
MPLTAAQKRYLRSFAHELRPIVLVGQKGVTEAVLAEFEGALAHHELVKVKLASAEREQRAAVIEAMRAHANAEVVQAIGKTASFYRRNPEHSRFDLPR